MKHGCFYARVRKSRLDALLSETLKSSAVKTGRIKIDEKIEKKKSQNTASA